MYNFFAVFGNPIAHSKSPEIYNALFEFYGLKNYYSRIFAKDVQELLFLSKELNIRAANVTTPFKVDLFRLSHQLSTEAQQSQSVNTVQFNDGQTIGLNTDIYGVREEILSSKINLFNKKIAIIGAGGASASIIFALQSLYDNLDITLFNRSRLNAERVANLTKVRFVVATNLTSENFKDFDAIFIAIPHSYNFLQNVKFNPNSTIFLANYSEEKFISKLKEENLNVIVCYKWLLYQAIKSFELFSGIKYHFEGNIDILTQIEQKHNVQNIYLSGFSGSGKSTIAPILAQKLNIDYVDLDKLIEDNVGLSINKIFDKYGESYFRQKEKDLLACIADRKERKIIALGAGALDNSENSLIVKKTGYNIYLYSNLESILQRIDFSERPILRNISNNKLLELFERRKKIYFLSSALVFSNCSDTQNVRNVDTTIEQLFFEIKKII